MASAWRTVQQFISAQGMGIFEVEVETETKETRCTCPVYSKRGSCKHIQFVNDKIRYSLSSIKHEYNIMPLIEIYCDRLLRKLYTL